MADVVMGAKVNSDDQPQCLSEDINMGCASCVSVKEQLHNALLELKSARSIIALQEDINEINAPEDIMKPTQCRESSVNCDEVNRNSIPVIHSCSKKTKKPVISLTRHNRQFITPSNGSTLLSNVQDSAVLKCSDTHHKPRVHYKDFDIPDIGHNAENTDCGQHESNCYTTSDTDKPRISDERVVLKAFLGINDAHSNINKPEKWLTSNMCSLSPRCHSASEFGSHRTFRRKRSLSSSSVTPRRNNPLEESIKKEHITGFQRSLKLLGLQPQDFGINNEVSTSKSRKSPSRIGPTFFTRLTNRSFSLENLKSLMQADIHDGQRTFGEHLDREMLSGAVYEAWYFQKFDEARRKQKAEVLDDRRKKEDFEKAKTDQKRKAEENFSEWKQLKSRQRQQWKQQQEEKKLENKTGGVYRLTGGTKEKPNQEKAFLLWKKEKDKLLKQKKIEQKSEKEKLKSDNEKKAAAEINYKLWKKRADETMREKAQKAERRRQQEEESKKEKEKSKHEIAESSFRAWKKKKDLEIKNKIKEKRLAEEEKKAIKLMQEAERAYAAEQVFEEWLDQVDRRQNKRIDKVHKQKQRIRHQFPWSPGGSVH